jgi:hypothetical protein
MIYDGFFDRYPKLKIIAAHGGGALPYLIARMDQCFDNIPACREKISTRPSAYVHRILADAVVFAPEVLDLVRQGLRRRQRAVRVRLSAHDRRHAGVPGPSQRPGRRCARQGAADATRSGVSGCSRRNASRQDGAATCTTRRISNNTAASSFNIRLPVCASSCCT